jgi:hypothetical protein
MQMEGRLAIVFLTCRDGYFYTFFINMRDFCSESQITAIKEFYMLSAGHTQHATNMTGRVFIKRDFTANMNRL